MAGERDHRWSSAVISTMAAEVAQVWGVGSPRAAINAPRTPQASLQGRAPRLVLGPTAAVAPPPLEYQARLGGPLCPPLRRNGA